ncbi:MAG TPA: aminopeptidase P family protein [Acholeplasma sp.]|jgi:Xaa-Pro aminopeptidase|nr:aminopeptidase P family protein [Acholeplasma sp.]
MNKEVYKQIREDYLKKVENGSLTILFSGKAPQSSGDQNHGFEVNRNFYYLTGIDQDNVIVALLKAEQGNKEYLFIEETTELMAKWNGRKLSLKEAKEISGIENVVYLDQFKNYLFGFLNSLRFSESQVKTLLLDLERRNDPNYHSLALDFLEKFSKKYPEIKVANTYNNLIALRMVKKEAEIKKIQEAIDVTKGGIEALMINARSGIYEYQLESFFDQYIRYHGQNKNSFKTIAGSGVNATILHYSKNNTIIGEGELILFDLGAEVDYYIADITRTFPVSGKFSKRQKEVYEAVLNVNKKCIAYLKPGITWQELNQYANNLITEELKGLGLIKEDSQLRKYYWHSIGHSIGLDTHDPSLYSVPLQEGMVVTIEPGIYIEEEKIGVRIEDNVLITKEGPVNLSKDIIKEVKDIEAFMKKNNKYQKAK